MTSTFESPEYRRRSFRVFSSTNSVRLVLTLAATCLIPALCLADTQLEKIEKAWRNRQQSFRSGKFEWSEDVLYTKGSILNPTFPKALNPQGAFHPPRDFGYQSNVRVSFQEDRIRYAFEGMDWVPGESEPGPQGYALVYDGNACRSLRPKGLTTWPVGQLFGPKRKFIEASNYHTWPVTMNFRIEQVGGGLSRLESFREVESKVVLNGRPCIFLEEIPKPGQNIRRSIWVDGAQGFTIARYATAIDGRPSNQIDLEYVHDDQHGWVPKGWRISDLNANLSINRSFTGKVKAWSLNTSLPDDEFEIEFPEGTVVRDEREETPKTYLVLKDGKQRPVLPNELGATYEEVLSSKPGKAVATVASSRWPSSTEWLIVLLALCVIAVLLALRFWKNLRRSTGVEK